MPSAGETQPWRTEAQVTTACRALDRELGVAPGMFAPIASSTFTFRTIGGTRLYLRDSSGAGYFLRSITADSLKLDTDGDGGYAAKLPIHRYEDADAPDSEFWQIPNFGELIRIGHAFTKVSQKTLKHDLEESQKVREEDLDYDRPTQSDVDR